MGQGDFITGTRRGATKTRDCDNTLLQLLLLGVCAARRPCGRVLANERLGRKVGRRQALTKQRPCDGANMPQPHRVAFRSAAGPRREAAGGAAASPLTAREH